MVNKKQPNENQLVQQTSTGIKELNETVIELSELVADLTINVTILEGKVERLSKFRDVAGYVRVSDSGEKQ